MNWQQANQHYLMSSLSRVRDLLYRAAGHESEFPERWDELLPAAEAEMPAPPAVQHLVHRFRLSPFERDLLLLCAGCELDAGFPKLCGEAQGDLQRSFPTFGLALASLPDAHWSALVPAAPLRCWRMIEVGDGESLTQSPLRIDERILHYLAGMQYLDARLESLLQPVLPGQGLPPSHLAVAERSAALLAGSSDRLPVLAINGQETGILREVAAEACSRLDLQLYSLQAKEIPASAPERYAFIRLWERESILNGGALFVDAENMDHLNHCCEIAQRLNGILFIASQRPLNLHLARTVVGIEVGKPDSSEQQELWRVKLADHDIAGDGLIQPLVSQFNLTLPMIGAACTEAVAGKDHDAVVTQLQTELWNACRAQARPHLDSLAQRIDTCAEWNDLVLPETQTVLLGEIAAHVHHRRTVFETWGFARRSNLGLGTSVIFAGPSGTGKTLAAEVLSHALNLDLYRIDLSAVVSKYIGETEKNLRRIFDAAEYGGAILLFDEADALFGKRSEVKDSHDRYANIEINYLLQRMESYRGLSILTTNQKSLLDTAFLRRIRFVVQFPFPDLAQRAEIWRRIFPEPLPCDPLKIEQLARLHMAGGNIRNIALNAAFLAADDGRRVSMAHLARAARMEYAKLEKPLSEAEMGGWR
jgi:hypothetical protein